MTLKEYIFNAVPIVRRFGVSTIATFHLINDFLFADKCLKVHFQYGMVDFFGYALMDIIFLVLIGIALLTLGRQENKKEFKITLTFFLSILLSKLIPVSYGVSWFIIGFVFSGIYLLLILLLTIDEKKIILGKRPDEK